MFLKIVHSGPRRYIQLAESYRNEQGHTKHRTIATLGRLDKIGNSLNAVHAGLSRILGHTQPLSTSNLKVTIDTPRTFGDIWALNQIWKQLGLKKLGKVLRKRTRHKIDLEAYCRIMVFNRLCDADSKLGVLRWLRRVSIPDVQIKAVDHHHLLRTMDCLVEHKDAVEQVLTDAVRPLVNENLSVVFYDITTVRVEGEKELSDDIRKYGRSKEGGFARQFMLGLVQTAEGIPLFHEVFEGNTAEVTTLKTSIEKVLARYPIRRVIAVADRGLLSTDNLDEMKSIVLPGGEPLEFILAVPARRYADFAELLEPINKAVAAVSKLEVISESTWQDLRLVVAHDKLQAREQTDKRDEKIAELEAQAAQWVEKLDAQDEGKKSRGRKLSDNGVRARFYHAVADESLSRIICIDFESELFTYYIDQKALDAARAIDGKLILVTNAKDPSAQEIVKHYKSLADIERGFRVLKSEIEIGPVYHRLPDRIRAHALICFIALILHRVMRAKLQKQPVPDVLTPERALMHLREIHTNKITLQGVVVPITELSTINEEHLTIFESLGVKKPTSKEKYMNF